MGAGHWEQYSFSQANAGHHALGDVTFIFSYFNLRARAGFTFRKDFTFSLESKPSPEKVLEIIHEAAKEFSAEGAAKIDAERVTSEYKAFMARAKFNASSEKNSLATRLVAPTAGLEPVADEWFADRSLPVLAVSGDVESDRVLKLHFRRAVNDQDRRDLTDALNLKIHNDRGELYTAAQVADAVAKEREGIASWHNEQERAHRASGFSYNGTKAEVHRNSAYAIRARK